MQDILTATTIAVPTVFTLLMLMDFVAGLKKIAIAPKEENSPDMQVIEIPIDWELPHKSLVVDPWLSSPLDVPCTENVLHHHLYRWLSLPVLPPAKELAVALPKKAKKKPKAATAVTPAKRRSSKAA